MNRRLLTLLISLSLLVLFSFLSPMPAAQGPQPLAVSPTPTLAPQVPPRAPQQTCTTLPNGYECTIASTTGWQQTDLTVQQGEEFTVSYREGTWTVDYRNWPYVGPEGYTPEIDGQISPGCKEDTSLSYATLLGKIGAGSLFPVGQGGTFTAPTGGSLYLRINDLDACLGDNDGSVIMEVESVSGSIDLEVTTIETPPSPICAGSSENFYAFIRNNGTTESGFFHIQWNADEQLFVGGHNSIPAGATDTHGHIWENIPQGQHTLTFTADYDNLIPESDENNNQHTVTFTAVDCSLVADFDAWPLSGEAPLTVEMHNISTGEITSCTWDYGDGTTGTSCADYHDHTYNTAGDFTVSLTVSGPGGSDTQTRANYIHVIECYTLTTNVNPSGVGSVSASPSPNCTGGNYSQNTDVQLTASPSSGYTFSNWSGDLSGSANPTTITMNGNKNITANFTSGPITCDTITEVPYTECKALEAFYDSTNGDAWGNWFDTNTPCSTPWTGIGGCTIPGNITQIDLINVGIIGTIPPELGNLADLEVLNLSQNQLSGSTPSELGNLTKLYWLDLSANQLSGSIPAQLGNTDMEVLYLDQNQLSGTIPAELGNLNFLWRLNLSQNQLNGTIPTQLSNLTNLQELDVGYNKLTASDPALITWLNTNDPDWDQTQTVPPINVQAVAQSTTSVQLNWTPILYTGDGGYYEVSFAPSSGGPYTVHGTTSNKSATGYLVTNLSPNTTYCFRVRTYTPTHGSQQNNLWSDFSETVCETTLSAVVADFTGSPTSGINPLTVNFTDQSTGDITSWSWDFGDGGSSTQQNPSHTYNTTGDFTVSLTVSGPGGSDTKTRTNYIHVTEQTCHTLTRTHTGSGNDPIASPANSPGCSPGQYMAGEAINVTASPASGWEVASWNGTHNDASTSTSNSLTMPAGNHTVTVNYIQQPTVQFSTGSFSVNEGNGSVTIEVTRSGSTADTVTVNYATSNGTATAGSDYTATSGTLSFAAGQINKTFTVPILDDALDEPNETVNLILSSPVNAVLGTPSSATLTIVDNDVCYTLTTIVSPSGSGSVSPSPPPNCAGGNYSQNTDVQLTASPNSGYTFSHWSGDLSGSANPTTVTMDGNKNITANFTSGPINVPSPRYGASMAFDSKRNKIVLFGGCLGDCSTGANKSNETWEFDGIAWTKINPSHSPSPRVWAGMVYDTQREVTVLFGGHQLNDTWEYDGTDWSQITTQNSPSARTAVDLAYDSGRQVVILSSGHQPPYCNVGTNFTDVWEYDGTNWTARINSGGPLNELPSIAYDPIRQKTIHFVGRHNCNLYSQTWAYDGTTISQLSPSTSPPPTSGPIRFDTSLAKIVLFGGCTGSNSSRCTQYSNDIWTFNGTTWGFLNTTNKPPGRYFHSITYDTTRQRLVAFGGCTDYYWGLRCTQVLNDLWEFDGTQWKKFDPLADFDAWPLSGEAPLTVEMHNISTGEITSCTWDYGDGTTGTSCAEYHNHTYTTAGSYTVSLTVSSPGGSDTKTRPNYISVSTSHSPPNDPLFSQQWWLSKIQILDAWQYTQGENNMVIAVIDTGVDYNHIDLGEGKTLTANDWDYVTPDEDAMDDEGHGTHVAGIAAANTNNGQGIAGVCPQCRILPLKALNSAGEGSHNAIATAIRYAADQSVRVINMSLGADSCTTDLANAINYAYERNVIIVAASGNACPVKVALGLESFEISYPARFDRVIAVGATNSADDRASFSSYGSTLDVTAPGVGILSTYLNNGYKRLDGTSMASPMVAGLAGLILSQNLSLTPAQVQAIIEQSADDVGSLGWDAQTGWGRVNANQAMQTSVGNVSPAPLAVCPTPRDTPVTAFSSKEEDLLALYIQLRDEVLMSTELGRSYVNLFYEYGPELAGILLINSDLRDRAAQFLDNASEEFGSLLPTSTADIALTQELYNEADGLVHDLANAGSPEFRDKMLQTWEDLTLDEHIGETAKEIWEQMQQSVVYLPIIIKNN